MSGRRLRGIGTAVQASAALAGTATVHAAPGATRLDATDGPGFTITVSKGGAKVRTLKAGAYRIVVHDRSSIHNFRLTGPGLNRATSVAGRPTVTWNVTLKNGTYTFVCDAHPNTMIGRFKVK
jgi:hypothetical protein